MHPQEEFEEKRRQRRVRITSWVIIILMVLSVGGFTYFGSGTTHRYNGFKFTQGSSSFLTTVDGVRYGFYNLPDELESLPTDPAVAPLLRSPFIFMTFNTSSNYTEQMAEVQYYTSQVLASRNTFVQPGIMGNLSYNLPIVTCANATPTQPVVAIVETNDTSIMLQNSCIIASVSSDAELYRVQDKLMLLALGVMAK